MRARPFHSNMDLALKPSAVVGEHESKSLPPVSVGFSWLLGCQRPPEPPAGVRPAAGHNKLLQRPRQVQPADLQIVDV